MATGVVTWSQTAASNATADGNVNWAEGMAASQVNDSARAMMASVAKWRDDNTGSLVAGGSASAYTVTSNQVFASFSSLNTQTIEVNFTVTNSAGATLNVDGLGAKPILLNDGVTAIPAGFFAAGGSYKFIYSTSLAAFQLVPLSSNNFVPPGSIMAYAGGSAPGGWLLCDGTGYSQTTFAGLFAAISTTYGSTGAGMFSVPDMRARVAVGRDPSNGTSRMGGANTGNISGGAANLGATGGQENHTLTTAELPSFTPSGTIGGSQTISNVLTSSGGQNVGSASTPAVNVPGSITVNGSNFTFTGNAIGSGSSHNSVPPAIILNYIIKT